MSNEKRKSYRYRVQEEFQPAAVLHGRIATLLRGLHVLTFGGGTN